MQRVRHVFGEGRPAYLGIDPGKGGGLAGVTEGGALAFSLRMPLRTSGQVDAVEILKILTECRRAGMGKLIGGPVVLYLEKAHSMPSQGVRSMFSYGMTYGMTLAAIEVSEITYREVMPRAWQKEILGARKKGKGDKSGELEIALELWPEIEELGRTKANNGAIDALLIAEYGRRRAIWEAEENIYKKSLD